MTVKRVKGTAQKSRTEQIRVAIALEMLRAFWLARLGPDF